MYDYYSEPSNDFSFIYIGIIFTFLLFIFAVIFIIKSIKRHINNFNDIKDSILKKKKGINHSDNDFITDGKKIQKKLEDLDYLYNRNLISKEEYEKTRENIISDK